MNSEVFHSQKNLYGITSKYPFPQLKKKKKIKKLTMINSIKGLDFIELVVIGNAMAKYGIK